MNDSQLDRPYHHGDLREALLKEASKRIADDGHEKISLRGCARAVGVDPSALYRHFPSKDDLIAAVALRYFAKFADQMTLLLHEEPLMGPCDEVRALKKLGVGYVSFAIEHTYEFLTLFDQPSVRKRFDHDARGKGGQSALAILETCLFNLSSFSSELGIERPELARIFWVALHGQAMLAAKAFSYPEIEQQAKITNAIIETIARGVGWKPSDTHANSVKAST